MVIYPDIAAKRAELSPHKVALHDVVSGRTLIYAQLNARAGRVAAMLRARGVAAGDRVSILCHNGLPFFELLFGCAKAGVVLVPLNWRQTPSELVPLLDDCDPRLLFHDGPTADLATALAAARPVPLVPILADGAAAAPGSFQALVDAQDDPGDWPLDWPAEGVWYMLYTSGTTGLPKAVLQTFAMAYGNHINLAGATDLTSRDVTPNYLPLFHTAGINLHTMPTLIVGGSVKVLPGFDPDRLLDLIGGGELTALLAVPAVYQALSIHPKFASTDLTKVRSWTSGGAPLPDAVLDLYLSRGAAICQGYGMTETGPTVFLMDPDNVTAKPGSVGKPWMMTRIRIVDAEGHDVERGDSGELLMKGPNITPGYFNRPEATAAALDADGWLHSGDVARQDDDGYVYIVDRIKDMYISGGENVYPAEVENLLHSHPDVHEAAVVGVADERWGEVGRAYLIAAPGRAIDADAIIAYCRENLAAYKVPKSVRVVTELPRTPAGKVKKHELLAAENEQ